MTKFSKILPVSISMGILLPLFVFAGLVPLPSGPEGTYTACDLFVLISNTIKFITWQLAPPIAILMLLVGGIIILTAGGNEGKFKQGKEIITQVVVGLVIILLAWLLVNTIITSLAVKVEGFTPETWYQFKCQ